MAMMAVSVPTNVMKVRRLVLEHIVAASCQEIFDNKLFECYFVLGEEPVAYEMIKRQSCIRWTSAPGSNSETAQTARTNERT